MADAMYDANVFGLYGLPEFAQEPPEKRREVLASYFDEKVAPQLSATMSSVNLDDSRERFIKAHNLSQGYDRDVAGLYAEVPEFASAKPKDKAKFLGELFDHKTSTLASSVEPSALKAERDAYIARNLTQADRNAVYGGWSFTKDLVADNVYSLGTALAQAGRQVVADVKAGAGAGRSSDMEMQPEELGLTDRDTSLPSARDARKGIIRADGSGFVDQMVAKKKRDDQLRELRYGDNPNLGHGGVIDPTGAAGSVGYSFATNVPAAAGGLMLGPLGAAAGAGLSAPISHYSTKDQFLVDAVDKANEVMKANSGRKLNQQEIDDLVGKLDAAATQYGAAEAIPEMVSNTIFGSVLGKFVKGIGAVGKVALAGRAAAGGALDIAGEHAGETVTQKLQGTIEAENGLRDKAPTWGEAFAEQAPTTNAMMLMTRGASTATAFGVRAAANKLGILQSQSDNIPGGAVDLTGAVQQDQPLALPPGSWDRQGAAGAPDIDRTQPVRAQADSPGQVWSNPMNVAWDGTSPDAPSADKVERMLVEAAAHLRSLGDEAGAVAMRGIGMEMAFGSLSPSAAMDRANNILLGREQSPGADIQRDARASHQAASPATLWANPMTVAWDGNAPEMTPVRAPLPQAADVAQQEVMRAQPDSPGQIWANPMNVAWDGVSTSTPQAPAQAVALNIAPSAPVPAAAKARADRKAVKARHAEQKAQAAVAQAQDLQQKAQVNPDFAQQAQAATQAAEVAVADAKVAQAEVVDHVQTEQEKIVAQQKAQQDAATQAMAKPATPPTKKGVEYTPMVAQDISEQLSPEAPYNTVLMPDLKFRDKDKVKVLHDTEGTPYTVFKGQAYRVDGHRGDDGSMKMFATAPFSPKLAEPAPKERAKPAKVIPKAAKARAERKSLSEDPVGAFEAIGRELYNAGMQGNDQPVTKLPQDDGRLLFAAMQREAKAKPASYEADDFAVKRDMGDHTVVITKPGAVLVMPNAEDFQALRDAKAAREATARAQEQRAKNDDAAVVRRAAEEQAYHEAAKAKADKAAAGKISGKDVAAMTGAEINKEMAAIDQRISDLTEFNIADGRGHERFSDIVERANAGGDSHATARVALSQRRQELRAELEERQRYHGSDKRIVRKSVGDSVGGMDVKDAQAAVSGITMDWRGAPEVVVVQTEAELLDAIGGDVDLAATDTKGNVQGAYHNGVVYIAADNHADAHEVSVTVAHEVLRHHGLRLVLGDSYGPTMQQAWHNDKVRERAVALGETYGWTEQELLGDKSLREAAVDEALAAMGDDGIKTPWYDKLIIAVQKWLRKIGLAKSFSDAEVRSLISSASEAARTGQSAGRDYIIGNRQEDANGRQEAGRTVAVGNRLAGPEAELAEFRASLRSGDGVVGKDVPGAYQGGDRGLAVVGAEEVQGQKWSPSAETSRVFSGLNLSAPSMVELEGDNAASAFRRAISEGKESLGSIGAAVYVYDESDYKDMRLFLSEDGRSGFALKGDDIVSVFSHRDNPSKRSAIAMVHLATQLGGRRLDAFDTVLPGIYAHAGFKVVARMGWNDEYAPDGWNKQDPKLVKFNNGEPDVVFMAYDPSRNTPYERGEGAYTDNYDDAVAAQSAALAGGVRFKRRAAEGQTAPQMTEAEKRVHDETLMRKGIPLDLEEAERVGFFDIAKQMWKNARTPQEKRDLRRMEQTFRQAYWMAKEHPEAAELLRVQTDGEESRQSGLHEVFDGTKKALESLSKAEYGQLTQVIHQLDGQQLKAVTASKFVLHEETNPDTGEKSMKAGKLDQDGIRRYELEPKHYEQMKAALESHGVQPKVADAYIAVRKGLDQALIQTLHIMQELKLDAGLIDKFRTSIGTLQNYFPHMRFGDHYINVRNAEGETVYNEHVDGAAAFAKRQLVIAKQFPEAAKAGLISGGKLRSIPETVYERGIDVAQISQVIEAALDKSGNTPESVKAQVRNEIARNVADVLMARGWAQHTMKRKNIPGYEMQDVGRVLAAYHSGHQGWLHKIEKAQKFAAVLSSMDSRRQPTLYSWARNFAKDMLRNQDATDRLVSKIRTTLSIWYIGGRISSAMLNLTQNAILGVPTLSMHTGLGSASVHYIKNAARALAYMVSQHRSDKEGARGRHMKPGELAFLKDFHDKGITEANFIREIAGLDGSTLDNAGRGIVKALFVPFTMAERFNRVSLALAAYRAARDGKITNKATLDKFGKRKGEKFSEIDARDFAREVTLDSHFLTGKANMPEVVRHGNDVQRGVLGSSYTFRGYQHGLLSAWRYMLGSRGWEGKKAFAYSMAAVGALGGIGSLPLFATMTAALRAAGGDDWDRDLYKSLREQFGDTGADVAMYGLGALAPVEVTLKPSMAMDFPVFGDMRENRSAGEQVVAGVFESVFGVPIAMAEQMFRAAQFWNMDNTYRAVESAAPAFAASIIRALRLGDEGATDTKGRPQAAPGQREQFKLGDGEMLAQGLGFTPLSKQKMYDAQQSAQRMQEHKQAVQSNLVARYVQARKRGDDERVQELIAERNEFNAKMRAEGHPTLVIKEPLAKLAREYQQIKKPTSSMRREYKDAGAAYFGQ